MLLRQVQAGPLQGHRLRALRRRGDPFEGPPRADGAHRPRRAGLPHLVLQGRPLADRLPDRHGSEGAREGPLLRRVDRHLDRRGGPCQGHRQAREEGQRGSRRLQGRARAARPGAERVARAPSRVRRERREAGQVLRGGRALGRGHRLRQEAQQGRSHEARARDPQGAQRRDQRHRGLHRRRHRADGVRLEALPGDEGQGGHRRRGRLPRAQGPLRLPVRLGRVLPRRYGRGVGSATCSSRSTSTPSARSSSRRSTRARARSRHAR